MASRKNYWSGCLLTASLLLAAGPAWALGLGEILVYSKLNQPLHAEIELLSAQREELDSLRISLASAEAFKKAGLERPPELSQLRFSVRQKDSSNSAYIYVSSEYPLLEPFISFLLELDWPRGHLLREYTVLLDLPVFSSDKEVASTPLVTPANSAPLDDAARIDRSAALPDSAPTADEITEQQPAEASDPLPQAASPQSDLLSLDEGPFAWLDSLPSATDVAISEDSFPPIELHWTPDPFDDPNASLNVAVETRPQTYGAVQAGETLWDIASAWEISNSSIQQRMMALFNANPQAFIQGNINRLKQGVILNIPEQNKVLAQTQKQVIQAVDAQNTAYQQFLSTLSPTASIPARQQKRLQLLADKNSGASAAGKESNNSGQQAQEIALLREEMVAERLKNEELLSRINELENVLIESQALLSLRNNEIARLQEQLRQQPESESILPATTEPVVPQNPPLPNSAPETDLPSDSGRERDPVALEERPAPPLPEPEVLSPASPPPPASEPRGLLDRVLYFWRDSLSFISRFPSWYVAAAGAALSFLSAFIWFWMRRRNSTSQDDKVIDFGNMDNTDTDASEDFTLGGDFSGMTSAVHNNNELPDQGRNIDETARVVAKQGASSEDETMAIDDIQQNAGDEVLSEADVYISYGLHAQAQELLVDALQQQPTRQDYRQRLLNILYLLKDAPTFLEQFKTYKEQGGAEEGGDSWVQILNMGKALLPNDPLFADASGTAAAPLPTAEKAPPEADLDLGTFAAEEDQAPDFEFKDNDDNDAAEGLDFGLEDMAKSNPDRPAIGVSGEHTEVDDAISPKEEQDHSEFPVALQEEDNEEEDESGETMIFDPNDPELMSLVADAGNSDDADPVSATEDAEKVIDISKISALSNDEQKQAEPAVVDGEGEDFDTMLDLAKAYIDMGEHDNASSALNDIVAQGNSQQKHQAQALLQQIQAG